MACRSIKDRLRLTGVRFLVANTVVTLIRGTGAVASGAAAYARNAGIANRAEMSVLTGNSVKSGNVMIAVAGRPQWIARGHIALIAGSGTIGRRTGLARAAGAEIPHGAGIVV